MSDAVYLKIFNNIDQGPQTAPKAGDEPSSAFVEFLKLMYKPEEAELVQHLKMGSKNFKSAKEIAGLSGLSEDEVKAKLEPLARRGRIIGFGGSYMLPPIPSILNNHQFSGELGPDDLKAAALYQKFFIEDGYYKYYESSEKGTQIMRVIPVEKTLKPEQKILETEEAHKIIEGLNNIQLVPCPCRTRTEKLGIRECKDKPVGFCIMGEQSAFYFQNMGLGKKATVDEAKKYFDEMNALGMVGTTENYDDPRHTVICLCCQCCCSQVRGRTRWQNLDAVSPSNFIAESSEDCVLCGECVERCMFSAISLDEDAGRAMIDEEKCMGCGVCVYACDQEALGLKRLDREKPFAGPRELFKTIATENREGKE